MAAKTSDHTMTLPHPEFTKIVSKPTHATLQQLKKEAYANAVSIASDHGGEHGLLGAVMDPTEYLVINNQVAFVVPVHPGVQPPAGGTTARQMSEANRIHDVALLKFETYKGVLDTTKKIILAAVDKTFLNTLEHPTLGYAMVTPRDMLKHLCDTYDTIIGADLELNRELYKADHDTALPIEDLWLRQAKCCAFATAGGDPLSASTQITLTLEVLTRTGQFTDGLRAWWLKPGAEKTWDEFKTHFTLEDTRRLQLMPANAAGYHGHGANAAGHPPPRRGNTAGRPMPPGGGPGRLTDRQWVTTADGTRLAYCWSHGLGFNLQHTGALCNTPHPGHDWLATITTLNSGSNLILEHGVTAKNVVPRNPTRDL